MKILIKHLTKLVAKEIIEKNKEKIKNQISTIKSLLGLSETLLNSLISTALNSI